MAQAVLEMFPDARLAIGPPIEDGFYYDFDLPRSLTPDDLAEIESRMRRIRKEDLPLTRSEKPREEAIAYEEAQGQAYKVELIHDLPRRRNHLVLHAGNVYRPLPGAACRQHRADRRLQARPHRGRVLARRRKTRRSYSASTASCLTPRQIWTPTMSGWKKRKSATIECWASSLACSPIQRRHRQRPSALAAQRRDHPARILERYITRCADWPTATSMSTRRILPKKTSTSSPGHLDN